MQKPIKYAIFQTKWGYFGLAGTDSALCRTHLPGPNPENIKSLLLKNLPPPNRDSLVRRFVRRSFSEDGSFSEGGSIEFDKTFFETLQQQIAAYFDGTRIDFSPKIPLDLDRLSPFHRSVLTACRKIRFGQTITYAELATKSHRPAAARAVGSALAKNPLPLLVPCHRVLRSDGQIGGFSAPGGITVKKRLLLHEQHRR